MRQGGFVKIFGAGVFFLLLGSTVGSIGAPSKGNNFQPLGILNFEPQSHDFGNMISGEINSTVFEIWTSGGCCELTFNLTWNCTWVTVFPTSGVSNGEHVPITVTVSTIGLDNGFHSCDILITSNGGDGIFNVTLTVIHATHPVLAYNPQSYDFGMVPQDQTKTTSFDIWNGGNGTLNYTFSVDKNWVSVAPVTGSSGGEHDPIAVSIITNGLINHTEYYCEIQIQSNGGNNVFQVIVTIGTMPVFEIREIKGGLFNIKTVIANRGTADAADVTWQITIYGNGFVLRGKETTGTITTLPMGKEQTLSTGMILGFGDVTIMVIIYNHDAAPLMKKFSGRLVLFYIKI